MTVRFAWLGGPRLAATQALVFVVAGAASMAPRSSDWIGSWKQALDLAAGSTVFIGPVAAGTACLVYARLRASAVPEIIDQSRRDAVCWMQPLIAVWCLAGSALLVVAVGATTAASVAGVPAYPEFSWIVVPALGVLAAQISIGAAIGYASGRPWAAPLVAVLVFVLFLWTVVGVLPEFFSAGGATGSLAGQVFTVGPRMAVGGAGVALAVCVIAWSHRRLFLATAARRVVVALAAGCWLASWFVVGDSSDGYATVAHPPLACAGERPQVCVFEETSRPLADLARRVGVQARALKDLAVPLPERFAESYVVGPEDIVAGEGTVVLLDEGSRRQVDDDRATDTLVRPATCPADVAEIDPGRAWDARRLLGRWLQMRAGLYQPGPGDSFHAWLTSDVQHQARWVHTTYRQLTACEFQAIRMPDGES